jgi:hypothetical protein
LHAKTTGRAFRFVDRLPEFRVDQTLESPLCEVDGVEGCDLVAGTDATTAKDAFVHVPVVEGIRFD